MTLLDHRQLDQHAHIGRAALGRQHQLSGLSMGSTGDFETAIEEGATVVRVGTAIFGDRHFN